MKTLKGAALSMIGLVSAIAAVGCGDTIPGWAPHCARPSPRPKVLCALAVSEEMDERSEQERRKIKRVAHHTSEWRDAQ